MTSEPASRFGLSPRILEDLRRVLARFAEVKKAVVFGSRARGTFRDASDIDLAIFAPGMSDRRFGELWSEIDQLPIVFKLDLVHWDRLSSTPLRQAIAQEGVPLTPESSPDAAPAPAPKPGDEPR